MRSSQSPPSYSQRTEAVREVLAGAAFRRAERLRGLLKWLTTRALDGAGEITEAEIAREVFGRTDYAGLEDSIVRVSMHQLRTKLREHYGAEGANSPIWIDIPKGAYTPRFLERATTTNSGPLPGQAWLRLLIGILSCAVVALGGLVIGLWPGGPALNGSEASRASLDWFLGARQAGPVTIVVGDAGYGFLQPYILTPPRLEDYLARRLSIHPELESGPVSKAFSRDARAATWTDWSHIQAAMTLSRTIGQDARLVHARRLDSREIRNGTLIILGSDYSNPWASLFESQLSFRFEARPGRDFSFKNLAPRPGEPARFGVTLETPGGQRSHARIAALAIPQGKGRVLLLAGLGTASTETAVDFVTNRQSRDDLLKLARIQPHDNFEIMLETATAAGTPVNSRIVSWRRPQ